MSSFSERLAAAVTAKKTPVLVGLDPRWEQLPAVFRQTKDGVPSTAEAAEAFEAFCRSIIDIVAPMVPAVKPQAAFFEQYGPDGMKTLAAVIRYAQKKGLLVILDGKRNDIGSTAAAYAAGLLGRAVSPWPADALTVSPYLGDDSLAPFIETAQIRTSGIFILVKTSNPGGKTFQDLIVQDGKPLYRHVAEWVESAARQEIAAAEASHAGTSPAEASPAGTSPAEAPHAGTNSAGSNVGYSSLGAVVGATWPRQLAELRDVMKSVWFLVPGYGSQGGGAADVAGAFDEKGLGALVNNSRGIIFAHRSPAFAEWGEAKWERAVEASTRNMVDALASETTAGALRDGGSAASGR